MEGGIISNQQITASSTHRALFGLQKWYPYFARLNKKGLVNAWTAAENDRWPWIQVTNKTGRGRHTKLEPSRANTESRIQLAQDVEKFYNHFIIFNSHFRMIVKLGLLNFPISQGKKKKTTNKHKETGLMLVLVTDVKAMTHKLVKKSYRSVSLAPTDAGVFKCDSVKGFFCCNPAAENTADCCQNLH